MAFLIGFAAAAVSYVPSCRPYRQPPTPAERTADAARITAATKQSTSAQSVREVLATPGWRMVWAQPEGGEPGVFLFRAQQSGWRYGDAWGGVTTDRSETLRWATGHQSMPPRLAGCFADQLMLEGP